MSTGDPPILAPPGTWALTLELLCRDARFAEFTPDSARYLYVYGNDAAAVLDHCDRQWECCDAGKQWVAANDQERIVVVQHAEPVFDDPIEDARTYWWAVEFYLTDDAYEDRLDELATVAVVA